MVATAPDLTLLSAVSEPYFECLLTLLASWKRHEPRSRKIVYDLGLTPGQKRQLKERFPDVALESFEFQSYPDYFAMGKDKGQYAWKPVIIYRTLVKYQGLLIWCDAANALLAPLDGIRRILQSEGIYSPRSMGTVAEWTHPGTCRYMHVPDDFFPLGNRNAALVGFNANIAFALNLAREWHDLAQIKDCIAPDGSSRSNHRQDQTVLTILYYRAQKQHGFVPHSRPLDMTLQGHLWSKVKIYALVITLAVLVIAVVVRHLVQLRWARRAAINKADWFQDRIA